MKLSIIVPVYNGENFIEDCINSISNQTYLPTHEIIIIDDGSTDSTPLIVKKMMEENVCINFYEQANQKQAVARNKGLSHASGEYILFVDADDTLDPNMLEHFFENNDNNLLSICSINKVYSDSSKSEHSLIFNQDRVDDQLIFSILTKNKELDVGLWNKLFVKRIIDLNGIKFNNENFFEDSLFVLEYLFAIKNERVTYIDVPLYNLYKRSDSTTTSFRQEIDELSEKYISKVQTILELNKVQDMKQLMVCLKVRTYVYVVHHHIKYDENWSAKKQTTFLLRNVPENKDNLDYLSKKYKYAFKLMIYFPNMYMKFYKWINKRRTKR